MSLSELLSSFELVDWVADSQTAVADATGVAVVKFGPVELAQLWAIERVVVDTNSVAATAASIYRRDAMHAEDLADYTAAGNADVADLANPIRVSGGDVLAIRWTGATVGAVCTANVQWSVLVRRA